MTVDRGVLNVDLSRLELTADATFAADLGTGAIGSSPRRTRTSCSTTRYGNGAVMDNDQTVASGENLTGTSPLGRSVDAQPTLTLDIESTRASWR